MRHVNLLCSIHHLKAKHMPVTTSKLRRLVKSKHPYLEHNLDSVVNVIRHSIQNAAAFEVVAQQLKEGQGTTVSSIFYNLHFGMIEQELISVLGFISMHL
jgi:carbonic anhydrase